jgi:hypothetical protein
MTIPYHIKTRQRYLGKENVMVLIRASLVIAILLLTGCASSIAEDAANTARWKGENIQTIIAKLGTPNQILHEPDGHTLYIYMTLPPNTFTAPEPPVTPVIALPHGKAIGIPIPTHQPMQYNDEVNCTRTLETNHNGVVVNASEQGYNCSRIVNRVN